jgi:membrane protease subunit HflK
VAETSHARARRAALTGLLLQLVTALAAFGLSRWIGSTALEMLAVYIAGGIPIWFTALLVFRQHELAALEAMDLEELRRERQATGGGEAIFDREGAGGLGFMVAKARLVWMQRWLIPLFGLLTAAYLIAIGALSWVVLTRRDIFWPTLRSVEIGLVLVSLVMLFLFFFSRYASGMARVAGWQLLRGCGSYMLGNAAMALAVIVTLGAFLYQGTTSWERYLTYAIPVVMVVLGAETLINFLLDIYRPRSPGVEPRACFDSRLLGLISEPGGIAHSLAEAINYQFGFKVSQTWFYQLLQRWAVPLVVVGALAVWLLSCLIVVQPYEHAIIERFGRQIDPEHPLGPGLHWKWPAPFEICRKYNTGQLHEFYVGYRDFDQPLREEETDSSKPVIELWTDRKHGGRDHFDFIIAPTPREEFERQAGKALPRVEETEQGPAVNQRAAQHLVRMLIVVQYTIEPAGLVNFTQQLEDPHAVLHKIAWNEVVQFAASNHIDHLMGEARDEGGKLLLQRIAERARELKLGLSVKFVGILQVHPTQQVAEAFRGVVTAQQEKIAEIREAGVKENEILSRVAGDKRKALALAHAIDQVQKNELLRGDLERRLRERGTPAPPQFPAREALRASMTARLEAQWQLELDRQELDHIKRDFELGLGGSLQDQARAEQAVQAASETLAQSEAALEAAEAPVRAELLKDCDSETAEALLGWAGAQLALEFWNEQLEKDLSGLEGEAAVTLAKAQAQRWELEMRAAGELALLQNERYAYAAAPKIYKARSYLQVLVDGLKDARKYFLAFEPGDRDVHIRLETQEQAQPDITEMPTSTGQ